MIVALIGQHSAGFPLSGMSTRNCFLIFSNHARHQARTKVHEKQLKAFLIDPFSSDDSLIINEFCITASEVGNKK